MGKNIDNLIINEIYRLYYCIDYNAIRWKRYTIPVLLDRLQRYNAGVGDYMLRDKFKRWIHHQRINMSKPLKKSRLS